ncbi:MAG: long-chain fatty acid--CoA ligase, partial [Actinomycetales bacterium]|nr:long-chain fatty acid--CoA ligase [Actinomycetales bacterium]
LASVRRIISGATTLDPELAEKFREASGHPVEQGYGLTETSPVITTTFVDQRDAGTSPVPSSVGRPIPGVEIDLRDALGGPATPGDPAQIWVRGNNLFSGYWPHGSGGPGPDGWWFTGDLGVLDENNELYLVERMGEKITVSGFGVYPSEVEEVLLEVPGGDQVAVIAAPHEVTGEAIVAFVVAADPDADSDALTEALSNYAAENLARFKRPGQIVVVAGLPHSPSGKVAKGRLRAIARDLTESNS